MMIDSRSRGTRVSEIREADLIIDQHNDSAMTVLVTRVTRQSNEYAGIQPRFYTIHGLDENQQLWTFKGCGWMRIKTLALVARTSEV